MHTVSKLLHKKGYRLTKQREQILDVLSSHPQSVEDILTKLKSEGVFIDKVTIYRTLDCFAELGIAGKIQFKDKAAMFELLEGSGHHHHLVCDNCGAIEDIPLSEALLLNQVKKQTDFQVNSHMLEFFGLCPTCQ